MTGDDSSRRLLDTLWGRDRRYYDLAREQVRGAAAAGGEYAFLDRHLPAKGTILEVGCGETSNMEVLAGDGRVFYGCDLSPLGIRMARDRGAAEAERAVVAAAEALPFAAGTFDAAFAVSVLEHLPEPELAIDAMIAVVKPGGTIVLVSPQYGGPLGASPGLRQGGARRFLRRLVRAHRPAAHSEALGWDRVHPPVLDGEPYEGDRDAIVEPEIRSLMRFLVSRGVSVLEATSGYAWHTWTGRAGPLSQRAVRLACETVGRLRIPPYVWFGPLVAVAAKRPGERETS